MDARRLLAGVLAALPALAGAQQVTLEPSAAVACLRHVTPGSAPEYPFDAFKQGHTGKVTVQLGFAGPDSEPAVELLGSGSDKADPRAFEQAVKAHVRGLRLPCMRAGDAPVRLVQEYSFEPDRRESVWYGTVDPLDEQRREQLACVRHGSGRTAPDYPAYASRVGVQGSVLARLEFGAPDQPPKAEVFARPSAALLRTTIEKWVQGFRMPCQKGGPVTAVWHFVFLFDGQGPYGFKPLTLPQLMGSVRGIRQQTLSFDTTRMNCPFDLRLQYLQPFLPNAVAEVAPEPSTRETALAVPARKTAADPSRHALLKWLAGVELVAPDDSLDAIFGDTALVSVPCVKIDLKPKE